MEDEVHAILEYSYEDEEEDEEEDEDEIQILWPTSPTPNEKHESQPIISEKKLIPNPPPSKSLASEIASSKLKPEKSIIVNESSNHNIPEKKYEKYEKFKADRASSKALAQYRASSQSSKPKVDSQPWNTSSFKPLNDLYIPLGQKTQQSKSINLLKERIAALKAAAAKSGDQILSSQSSSSVLVGGGKRPLVSNTPPTDISSSLKKTKSLIYDHSI